MSLLDRRKAILSAISKEGSISVIDLTAMFEVSEVSIRKDLAVMAKQGLLIRTHGGARLADLSHLDNHDILDDGARLSRIRQNTIAKSAAQLLEPRQRLILDAGKTTMAMVPYLNNRTDLVVLTPSLAIAMAITQLENPPTLIMAGGTWDAHLQSFQGPLATEAVRAYDFDWLFVGADGLDLERGTTTFKSSTQLSRDMAAQAQWVVVLAESHKLGRRIPHMELPWSDIDLWICDADLSTVSERQLDEKNIRVMKADQLLNHRAFEATTID